VSIPIEVVPLGIDPEEWPVLTRNEQPPQTPFRFLMYADGEWENHRKGFPLALKAFSEEFGTDSGVELYLKVTSTSEQLWHVEKSLPSNVHIIKGKLAQHKLLTLLRKAHCLLFPSSGEGFGLPPREAMATGIPAILAGFAGLESITLEDIAFPLKWTW